MSISCSENTHLQLLVPLEFLPHYDIISMVHYSVEHAKHTKNVVDTLFFKWKEDNIPPNVCKLDITPSLPLCISFIISILVGRNLYFSLLNFIYLFTNLTTILTFLAKR